MRGKLCLLVCAAFVVAFAGGVVSEAGSEERPPTGARVAVAPQVKAGSSWVLRYQSGDRRVQLARVEDGTLVTTTEGVQFETIYSPEWNVIAGPGPRSGAWTTYSPHVRRYSFPLWEGKTWGGDVAWSGGGARGSFTATGAAKGWETVRVPAGRFEAIRVEASADGRLWATCWYAVEAQHPIKCTFTQLVGQNYELASYSLAE